VDHYQYFVQKESGAYYMH